MKIVLRNDSTILIKILQWVNGIKYNKMAFVRTNNGPRPPPPWPFLLSWWSCFLPGSWSILGPPIIHPRHKLLIFWVLPGPIFHRLQTRRTLFLLRVDSSEIAWGTPTGLHSKTRATFPLCITRGGGTCFVLCLCGNSSPNIQWNTHKRIFLIRPITEVTITNTQHRAELLPCVSVICKVDACLPSCYPPTQAEEGKLPA